MDIRPLSYTCGYCGKTVGPSKAFSGIEPVGAGANIPHQIYICSFCNNPTHFSNLDLSTQIPGVPVGREVASLPSETEALYNEARRCVSVKSYTAAVLCCRKLLMHIAVEKGAPEGKKFAEYIDYLEDHHFSPPGSREWVDHIRTRGNEANHTIELMSLVDARNLISFSEMLLAFIYEFPGRIAPALTPQSTDPR